MRVLFHVGNITRRHGILKYYEFIKETMEGNINLILATDNYCFKNNISKVGYWGYGPSDICSGLLRAFKEKDHHSHKIKTRIKRNALLVYYDKILSYAKPDLVHLNGLDFRTLRLLKSALSLGLRAVVTIHVIEKEQLRDPDFKECLELIKNNRKRVAVIVLTEWWKDFVYNIGLVADKVIRNPVLPPNKIIVSRKDKVEFINVGTISKRKNQFNIVKAFHYLNLHGDYLSKNNLHLSLIGGGEDYGKVKEFVEEKGLNNYIALLGNKSEEYVKNALENSHVYLHLSSEEGESFSLLEALSYGMPTLTWRGVPDSENVKDSFGISLSDNSNILEIAKGVVEIHKMFINNNFNFDKISNITTKEHSLDNFKSCYLTIYEKLYEGNIQ